MCSKQACHNSNTGNLLLQLAANACDGAASARSNDTHIQSAIALSDDLLGSAFIVRQDIALVVVLVGDPRVRDFAVKSIGDANVALGCVPRGFRGRADYLSTKRQQRVGLQIEEHSRQETELNG